MMGSPAIDLITGLAGHQDRDFSLFQPASSAPPLDGTDGAGDRLVENDFIHFRDIQPFFGNRSCNEDVKISRAEAVKNLFLLFLREAETILFRLSDKNVAGDARSHQLLDDDLRRITKLSKNDDFGVTMMSNLFGNQFLKFM